MTDIIQTIESQKYQERIDEVLPKRLPLKRFTRSVIAAIKSGDKILSCDPNSIYSAVMSAAQLGLEPGTLAGYCDLIPRKNKGVLRCNLELGYKGFMFLAWESGKISGIVAHVRHENDEFKILQGTTESIHHVPFDGERGEKKGAYAILNLANGGQMTRYLNSEEVLSARGNNWKYSVWGSRNKFHVAEMWAKTAIKRLLKYAPLSPEIQSAVALEETYARGATLKFNHETGQTDVFEPGTEMPQLPAREENQCSTT